MATGGNNGCGCNKGKSTTGIERGGYLESIVMNVAHYGCVNPLCDYETHHPYKYGGTFELTNYSCPLCNSEVKLIETAYLLK